MLPVRETAITLIALMLGITVASAQEEKAPEKVNATALAKQTQNPVADLVSIPFQFNFNSGGGLDDGTLYNLNIQPVIPITLNKDWKLIARAIVPYISSPAPDGGQEGGFGDIQLQSYFTQAHSGKVIWGIGPLFSFPAATNPLVRTGSPDSEKSGGTSRKNGSSAAMVVADAFSRSRFIN